MPDRKSQDSGFKVLYSSEMLRNEIRCVLGDPQSGDRRVVLVAFVGGQAESFLPDPDGLQIVCALQPGSTDGVTLSRLKARKAVLFKSDRLHMKVYWSSRNGCVICSANASGNALGGGDLREAGAWFPAGAIDIERLWQYADPKPLKEADLTKLTNLGGRLRRRPGTSAPEARSPDFLEWLSLAAGKKWKLGWWNAGDIQLSKGAREKALKSYGVHEPTEFLLFKEKQAVPGDWFLTFEEISCKSINWMYLDFVIQVPKSDKPAYSHGYPYQGVQLEPLQNCPAPPFLIDARFRKAFKAAVKIFGMEKITSRSSLVPQEKLLRLIEANWSA